jgi:hypothetical protein
LGVHGTSFLVITRKPWRNIAAYKSFERFQQSGEVLRLPSLVEVMHWNVDHFERDLEQRGKVLLESVTFMARNTPDR